jgi:hypothetical protein
LISSIFKFCFLKETSIGSKKGNWEENDCQAKKLRNQRQRNQQQKGHSQAQKGHQVAQDKGSS